jgi:hypothetical protein
MDRRLGRNQTEDSGARNLKEWSRGEAESPHGEDSRILRMIKLIQFLL